MRWPCRSNAYESRGYNGCVLIFLAAASLTASNAFIETIWRVIGSIVVHVAKRKRIGRNHKYSA